MIVDMTGNPFVVMTGDGIIRYVSGSIERVLGWPAAALPGRSMADFLRPDQLEMAVAVVAEIDERDRAGSGVPMVFALQRPDGETVWAEIGASPLLDVPGVDAIVLRLRPFDAQHHFDAFLDALLADEPLDVVLLAFARSTAEALEADGAVVHHGYDGEAFSATAGFGLPLSMLPADAGPWRDCVGVGTAIEVATADLPAEIAATAMSAGYQACWTVPVPHSLGIAPAALSVWRMEPGGPLLGHRTALARAARNVALALVRTAEHQRLRHLAGHDSLTGVANRAEFRDRLAHALAIGERDLAVAFCDLDDFKPVNDTYGHSAGDAVLVQVADRLRLSLRTGDELARVGGDEFTVLLRNVADAGAATHVTDRLLATVREPFDAPGDGKVQLGLSVGVALTSPGSTADELLAQADAALYEVKRAGGGAARVATPEV
jgi:diguanylate cyclase (GGDEF)-like protein/PAS domain S-box-containing protein